MIKSPRRIFLNIMGINIKMGKRFRGNCLWLLKSIYYMKDPKKITKEITNGLMTTDELATVTVFLENKDMIRIKDASKTPFHISLTDKGVDFVVSELDRKNQSNFNRIIAFTAAILALIGIYTFVKDIGLINESNAWIKYIFLGFVVIAIGPIVTFIIKSYFLED